MTRLYTGQKIRGLPDATWNRLVDMLESQPGGHRPTAFESQLRPGQLVVAIEPDFDMVEHGVALISEPVYLPPDPLSTTDQGNEATLSHPIVQAVSPTTALIESRAIAAISLEPIAQDQVGPAVLVGLSWARVNLTNTTHTTCGPQNGNSETLASGSGSIKILWSELNAEATKTGEQWCLVLLGNAKTIPDMFYGTVGSYDATYKIITTTGIPTELPTGTPPIPAGVKVFDREAKGFTASENFYAIRQVNVYNDSATHNTHGQVDWVVFPTAAANPVRAVVVDKNSGGQSGGNPVFPLTVNGNITRYFSGTLSTAGDIWILLNQNYDNLVDDSWLPALATFNGLQSGTYDPNAADPTNFPTSDERDVYRIDGLPHGMIPGYTTTAFTAASDQGGNSPVFTTGSFQTYTENEAGAWGHGPLVTGVRYNLESAVEAGTVGFIQRGRGSLWLLPSCKVGSDYSGS